MVQVLNLPRILLGLAVAGLASGGIAGADPGAGWIPPSAGAPPGATAQPAAPGFGQQPLSAPQQPQTGGSPPWSLQPPKSQPQANLRPANTRQPSWAVLSRGRSALLSGNTAQALQLIQQFVALQPLEPDGYFWLGLALDESDQPEPAAAAYRKAIAQASIVGMDSAEAHTNLGNVLLKLGRVDEGVSEYKRAQELEPKSGAARLNLARGLIAKGEAQQALETLDKCDQTTAPKAQMHYYRAKALKVLGKTKEAGAEAGLAQQFISDDAARAAITQEFAIENGAP